MRFTLYNVTGNSKNHRIYILESENNMSNPNSKYHIVYGIMLAVFFGMIIWLVCRYDEPSMAEELFSSSVSFEDGWHTEDGESITLNKLQKLESAQPYEEFSIYNTLPDDIEDSSSLFFRSKNIFYSVYIDGKLVLDPSVPQSVLYTKAFGTRWSCVLVSSSDAGKEIEFRITTVYESARASIDNIYIGDSGGLVLNVISERLVAFITCILLMFVGLLLIIADIPINMQARKNHELMYLGLFALSIAIWCLSETNLIQLYSSDSRMVQVVSCSALMLIPIPTVLYLNSAFGFSIKQIVPAICILSFIEFLTCWILHFLGIADIHDTLTVSHIMLAICAVIMFYVIIKNSFVKGKNQTKNVYRILRGIGLCCLSIATIIDILRYYTGSVSDTAMFVRIGLLIFIICYGSSSLENTINAVKLGIQTEFVSRLAYHDGLTGIGNRTAFEEHLVDLEKIKDGVDAVGIIMFDVNDLKYVNDNLGHHYGDSMLMKSAEIIQNAFEKEQCDCFRIGGDEFAVLLSGENVALRYERGIRCFEDDMQRHNEQPDKDFRISIAYGFAMYNKDSPYKKLMDIYQQADMKMYENKKAMKAVQSRPEEYYKSRASVEAVRR